MEIKRTHYFDYTLAAVVAILVILGISVLASVSAVFSQEKYGNTTYFLLRQIGYGLVFGILLGFIAFKIKLSFFKDKAWFLLLGSLVLMVLVFIPGLGIVSGGASRWLNLKFISFQPSELLKLTFILYLSVWLANRTKKAPLRKTGKNWQFTLIPFLVIVGIIALLLTYQSDISTLGIIVSIAILMYFLASTPLWHTILIILVVGGGMSVLIRLVPYRMERLAIFLGLKSDPMGMGYQIKQALIAVGSGGILGLGLGMSNQKFGFLPQTISDSIFAIFAEETGLVGALFLILLFLIFLWRGFKIAKSAQDKFSQLLAVGIVSWICIQAFINISAMIGILPLTGIPLPFISYGGSHLVVELIGIGILLNISKSCKR